MESNEGVSKAKQHQIRVRGNVKASTKTPEKVKLILQVSEEARLARVKSVSNEDHKDDDEATRI